MMHNFKSGWPFSFYGKISKCTHTMQTQKKHVTFDDQKLHDKELIYARLTGLQASGHNIAIVAVLFTKIDTYHPSMFDQKVMSERIADVPDTIVFDVSALMWAIQWPSDTLRTSIEAFKEFVVHALEATQITQIFLRKHKTLLAHIKTNEKGNEPPLGAF